MSFNHLITKTLLLLKTLNSIKEYYSHFVNARGKRYKGLGEILRGK